MDVFQKTGIFLVDTRCRNNIGIDEIKLHQMNNIFPNSTAANNHISGFPSRSPAPLSYLSLECFCPNLSCPKFLHYSAASAMAVLIMAVTIMMTQYVILIHRMQLSLGANHLRRRDSKASSGARNHLMTLDRLLFCLFLGFTRSGNVSTAVAG